MSDVLDRLAARLREEGGLLAEVVADPATGADTGVGDAAAPRGADYELLVEAIREGELLHYGEGRVVVTPDPDLALLAGDRLYAIGLARLAELGDVAAVAVLADVISDCARAHAEGRPDQVASIWRAGAAALAETG